MIYDSWADMIINLPTDMAGEYTQKLLKYAIYEEAVEFDNPALRAMFISVKNRLDEDLEKYQAKVERAKSISKRNRNDIDTISKRNRSEIEGVNVNDNVNDNDKYKKKNTKFHNFSERHYDYTDLKAGANDV